MFENEPILDVTIFHILRDYRDCRDDQGRENIVKENGVTEKKSIAGLIH